MKFKIWMDSEIVKTVEAESFDVSMFSLDMLKGEYQIDLMVEAQTAQPREEAVNKTEISDFFGLDPVIPACDGFEIVWSGYWSREDGFTSKEEAEHKTIEYLFG